MTFLSAGQSKKAKEEESLNKLIDNNASTGYQASPFSLIEQKMGIAVVWSSHRCWPPLLIRFKQQIPAFSKALIYLGAFHLPPHICHSYILSVFERIRFTFYNG